MSSIPVKVWVKDPDAYLDYILDWSEWLGADTISTASWEASPSGITVASTTTTTTLAAVWLSGGVHGTDYDVRCRVVTAGGRTDDRTIRLQVRHR